METTTTTVIVGAGVHGLSTALHLAELRGSGEGVVVLEKQRVGAGASGISGGIVRNFYLSGAMNELVRRSVEIFELDPGLFGFRQVGYVAVVPAAQAAELERIAAQHEEVGYGSTLVQGEDAVRRHMTAIHPDWRTRGSTTLLHEERSGWADPTATLAALAGMARAAGVEIREHVEVTGFELAGGAVNAVETSAGPLPCDLAVIAPGPWARDLCRMLDLPQTLAFHYWQVREGEYVHAKAALDPRSPVVHLDADEPLPGLPSPWGIYFRPGLGRGAAVGGLPLPLDPECELDPYGPSHPELGETTAGFDAGITAAMAWALGRFEGGYERWTCSSYGAQTCFTPDSYPVVGFVRENVYAVLDSNHGFKLLALGKLAAEEILGRTRPELDPFRLERLERGALHAASSSPYPWT
ncbi:MAG TPA: FAD-binding oxidoreductase [Gaiellaceae bacterium]|nr:FAD-binding oxidoreductase [Gaiellaceae bacterium]